MRWNSCAALIVSTVLPHQAFSQIDFYDMTTLSGSGEGVRSSGAANADGSFVVFNSWGWTAGRIPDYGFIWDTKNKKIVETLLAEVSLTANAFSDDGTTVVGHTEAEMTTQGFIWTKARGVQKLNRLVEGTEPARALAVSKNGEVVVGYSDSRAVRWTTSGGIEDLGALPWPLNGGSSAWSVSADGSRVVGFSGSGWDARAFLWTTSDGMTNLGTLPGHIWSQAFGISSDGTVVVGASSPIEQNQPSPVRRTKAFRWTESQGMQSLENLPLNERSSFAHGVSGDGAVIVGDYYAAEENERRAFFWSAQQGFVDLTRFLAEQGINLKGWTLNDAWDVSSDGRTISGWGFFNGRSRAYLVRSQFPFSEVPAIDRIRPTLRVAQPKKSPVSTKARSYLLKGSATDNATPTRAQFRIRAPGKRSYGKWASVDLPAQPPAHQMSAWPKTKNWSRKITLSRRGNWSVQIRALDARNNASAIKTVSIIRR
jgi:uncharacterized membrane protein